MITRDALTSAMRALCAAFERELSPLLIEVYERSLSDLDDASLISACDRAMRECKFFPRAAELRAFVGAGSPEHLAVAAWAVVRGSMGRGGVYISRTFEDPIVNAAIRSMGGWEALCALEDDAVSPWAHKEFERQYIAWSAMRPSADLCAPLPGLVERLNNGTAKAELLVISCPYLGAVTARAAIGPGKAGS